MDRSPSESSLEKIERTDVIEISSHNAIVMQTKENAEVEKEEAVREALAKAEAEWKAKLEAEVAAATAKQETDKQVIIVILSLKYIVKASAVLLHLSLSKNRLINVLFYNKKEKPDCAHVNLCQLRNQIKLEYTRHVN